ncbi:MAG: molybdopterin oxidoreductase [Gammaproteobacteria bacterium]|jgi:molybdopterin-containing oxidoreductase family membrane subunit|nr:molybdopterin oxidoreductase [Gammaproteobacteria bacterium]
MRTRFLEVDTSKGYLLLLGLLGALLAAGLGAAWIMEHHGHHVTGMDNQIVWGLPHVFAVFLIVAASGALNVASIGSVFGKMPYKPLARLSGLLAIALLAGGLMILVLDLGRPDRLIVAMTTYNFKSIFAWNIFLYNGFFLIVAAYLWTLMDRTVSEHAGRVGLFAFVWRLILTTGTGSIFGFLIAREAYDAAIMAPLFIALSLVYGKAIFILVATGLFRGTGRELDTSLLSRLRVLLGTFIAAALLLTAAQHLTNLYAAEHLAAEMLILRDGGSITQAFWIGQILLGSLLPMWLLLNPAFRGNCGALLAACVLVILGGLATMYVTIIGGQSVPLELFPGMEISSSFFDGEVIHYAPSLPELGLGLGGGALALLVVLVGVRVLPFLPDALPSSAAADD